MFQIGFLCPKSVIEKEKRRRVRRKKPVSELVKMDPKQDIKIFMELFPSFYFYFYFLFLFSFTIFEWLLIKKSKYLLFETDNLLLLSLSTGFTGFLRNYSFPREITIAQCIFIWVFCYKNELQHVRLHTDCSEVFRTLPNICDGAFLRKYLTHFSCQLFSQISSIIYVWQGSKCFSELGFIVSIGAPRNNIQITKKIMTQIAAILSYN